MIENIKKIPDEVLNAPYSIREGIFLWDIMQVMDLKKDPALTLTNKGEIGCAGLFFLIKEYWISSEY